jgi:hypothetical protein
MKKILCIITLLKVALVSGAATVTDTFDRADTTYSTNGADIGANWFASSPENDWQLWQITNNVLQSDIGNALDERGQSMLLNNSMTLACGNGTSFAVSADVKIGYSNAWGGIVFNYQNPSNYCTLRINGIDPEYQFLAVVDGANATVVSRGDALTGFSLTNFYTLSVWADTEGRYDFTITEAGSTTKLNPTAAVIDSTFTGGYAGLYNTSYNSNPDATYDNFSLSVDTIPGNLVTDDFNRAPVDYTSDGSLIRSDWVATGGTWSLTNSALWYANTNSGNMVLYNTAGLTDSDGDGLGFTVRADVKARASSRWGGIMFNYQNPTNFYMFRFKSGFPSYQLIRYQDGTTPTLITKSDALESFAVDSFYTLTVTSTNAYEFDCIITRKGKSEQLNPFSHAVDGTQAFTGGRAGLYIGTAGNPSIEYDNFLLAQVNPMPTEIGTVGMGLSGPNLVFSWPGDADGTYALQSRMSLVTGEWSNVVGNISGMDGTMSATNDTSAAQAFFRVVVE